MAMLMLARNVVAITTSLKANPWDEARMLGAESRELAALTAGIVGVGEIGRRLARILRRGFGMRVLYTSRGRKPDAERELAAAERLAPHASPLLLAILDFRRHQHDLSPSSVSNFEFSSSEFGS